VVVGGRWQEARGFRLALGYLTTVAIFPLFFLYGWLHFNAPLVLFGGLIVVWIGFMIGRLMRKRARQPD
jgi:hypothetical protein